jgi:four helix bundle protein
MKFKFEDLRIYQESLDFTTSVFSLTKQWLPVYKYSLVDQLQRAALSIPLNIAEGSGRTSKDFAHFLTISRGSCYECIAILTIAKNVKVVSESEYTQLYDRIYIMAKTISALKTSILPVK